MFKSPMLRSDLFNYSDVYIVVKGVINLRTGASDDMAWKDVLKNNAPLR